MFGGEVKPSNRGHAGAGNFRDVDCRTYHIEALSVAYDCNFFIHYYCVFLSVNMVSVKPENHMVESTQKKKYVA